jgi:hypothetical protein
MVIPLVPTNPWAGVSLVGEPWVDAATGDVFVQFDNTNEIPVTVNVLFWDPDTKIGPGQASTYNVLPG